MTDMADKNENEASGSPQGMHGEDEIRAEVVEDEIRAEVVEDEIRAGVVGLDDHSCVNSHQVRNVPEEPQEEDSEPGIQERSHTGLSWATGEGVNEATSQTNIPEDTDPNQESTEKTDHVGNSTATVKIVLIPEGYVMTMAFAIGLTMQELKQHFATELQVPAEILQITLDGAAVEEQETLMDLGVQPHGTTQLEMRTKDPVNHPLRPAKHQQEYNMPDVLTVLVRTDPELEVFREVVVEIERSTRQKAFLGGYRHKLTGAEYHHAAIQTVPKSRPDKGVPVFSRCTQTVEVKTQGQLCSSSTSTQMTKTGCFVSCVGDRVVTPGNYVTAAEYHGRRLKAVITLQTYVRRWRAMCLVRQLKRDRDWRLAMIALAERRKTEEKEARVRALHNSRMNPSSKEDFNLLFHDLENWKREEVERINSTLCGAERKAAMYALLEKETQFIASIGRLRVVAHEKNYDTTVMAFLNKYAAAKKWKAYDKSVVEVDTPHTIRAKELRDLYNVVNSTCFSQEERLDVLLRLKHTAMEHDCKLTREIVELIDREVDLMTRGVKKRNLEGLRGRISDLLLQYIKTPTFNPEVARLLKVPQSPSQLRHNMHFCRSCQRYLPSTDFSLKANLCVVGQCWRCEEQHNETYQRVDVSCYQALLRSLRHDEKLSNNQTKISCLLKEKDVQYLVDVVWGAQSALGTCKDLHDLAMVRWDRQLEWSPWNCVLLTKEEASAHLKLADLQEAYGMAFIETVIHKHTLAQKYFAQIPAMAQYLHTVESQRGAASDQLVIKSSRPAL